MTDNNDLYTLLKEFYNSISFDHFNNFTMDRKAALDMTVAKTLNSYYKCNNKRAIIHKQALEKIKTSEKLFGFQNDDEKIYYIISVVDPNLDFLKKFCTIEDKSKTSQIFKDYFGYFDKNIIICEYDFVKKMKKLNAKNEEIEINEKKGR